MRQPICSLNEGINFFDTAQAYTDSEAKIGYVLSARREQFTLAAKTMSADAEGFWNDLHTGLKKLNTDCVDIYQFHNPAFCPKPEDGTGLYEAMEQTRDQGKIRFIGITNHRLAVAREAVASGLYDTLQFPFNYLAIDEEIALVESCKARNIGFISMKALSGPNRYSQLCPYVIAAASLSGGGASVSSGTGENGAERPMRPLQSLSGPLPLWSEHAGAAAAQLRRLQDIFMKLLPRKEGRLQVFSPGGVLL